MTIIPNLLGTGILAILVSLVYLAWATLFVERRHAGLVLMLLCPVMLVVGAGFGPPILGVIVGSAATRINAPLTWWKAHLSENTRRVLAKLWPLLFTACLIDWLLVMPGIVVLNHFFGVNGASYILAPIAGMPGLLFLSMVAAFAHDLQRQAGLRVSRPKQGWPAAADSPAHEGDIG